MIRELTGEETPTSLWRKTALQHLLYYLIIKLWKNITRLYGRNTSVE